MSTTTTTATCSCMSYKKVSIPFVCIQLAYPVNHRLVPFMVAMRHVEASYIHATSCQGGQHFCGATFWAYSTYDFGTPCAPEPCSPETDIAIWPFLMWNAVAVQALHDAVSDQARSTYRFRLALSQGQSRFRCHCQSWCWSHWLYDRGLWEV